MEQFKILLNNFLYNSGILGFYRILDKVEKTDLIHIKGNCIEIEKQAFDNFEEHYFKAMMDTFEKDTKWYRTIKYKERLIQLNLEKQLEELKHIEKYVKDAIESASYKSGFEIIKNESEENPYELLKKLKQEKNKENKREILLEMIGHIEKNKQTYCMKDIIYTKINCFWSNVSFLNRSSNKNDMKEEYKKVFVIPAQKHFQKEIKGEYKCIECGSSINKQEAYGMSWLNDVGVDMKKKNSAFWNFKEDAYICPICNLIYSCIPLGFYIIGNTAIFINSNESFSSLKDNNDIVQTKELMQENNFNNVYHKVITNYIKKIGLESKLKNEPKNIQVIKRIRGKDKQYYEFNMLSKDKLEIIKKASKYIEQLTESEIYEEILNNTMYGVKQYKTIDKLITQNSIKYIPQILKIEAITMKGGINMEERKEYIEEMINAGEKMQIYFYKNDENKNKLEAYKNNLQRALRADSIVEFMKIFTLFYGGLNLPMPNGKAMLNLIEEPEEFRLLGYSYIYGLGKIVDRKGEKINEE